MTILRGEQPVRNGQLAVGGIKVVLMKNEFGNVPST